MRLSNSVFAGLACGSLMGVFFLGVAVVVIISRSEAVIRLANVSFRGMSTVRASVFGAMATVIVWTLIGAMLGLIHYAVAMTIPGKGIGSPTASYTIGIVALSFGFSLIANLHRREYAKPTIAIGMGFAIVFGWLLPWLAY